MTVYRLIRAKKIASYVIAAIIEGLVLLQREVYRHKSPTEMQGEVYRLIRTYRAANRVRFGLGLGLRQSRSTPTSGPPK